MTSRCLLVGDDGYSQRNVIAAARALGRVGWQVDVAAPWRGLAARSRYVRRYRHVPSPSALGDGHERALRRTLEKWDYDVVFATGDAELMMLTSLELPPGVTVPHPAQPVVRRAVDKLTLFEAATGVGLPAVETLRHDDSRLATLRGPVIVKSRMHWDRSRRTDGTRFTAQSYAAIADAADRMRELVSAGGEPIVQRLRAGKLLSYVALIDATGSHVARVQQVADAVWPLKAGTSTRARIVPIDGTLAKGATRLLDELRWTGLVQLQFIAPPHGRPQLIDLNGRFYGSMGLAIAAGVNFPALWAELALGGDPRRPSAAIGTRYQWLEGDIRRALAERRGGLLRDVVATVQYGIGATPSLVATDDMRPAAEWTRRATTVALRKLRQRVSRNRGGELPPSGNGASA